MGFRSDMRRLGLTSQVIEGEIAVLDHTYMPEKLHKIPANHYFDRHAAIEVITAKQRGRRIERPVTLVGGNGSLKHFQRMFMGKVRYLRMPSDFFWNVERVMLPIFSKETDFILWNSLAQVYDPHYFVASDLSDNLFCIDIEKYNSFM